jgi:hypothetical protein
MRICRLRLHVFDIHDLSVIVYKRDGERNKRVFHPHADLRRLVKQEHHSFVRPHFFAEHESLLALRVVGGYFGLDQVDASGEGNGLESLLCCSMEIRREHGGRQDGSDGEEFGFHAGSMDRAGLAMQESVDEKKAGQTLPFQTAELPITSKQQEQPLRKRSQRKQPWQL